jgi:hypothetical protein
VPNLEADFRDKTSPVWDMSQERVLMEQNLAQRFNFFLVFFALVVAGALNSRTQPHLQIVLTLGTVVASVLAAALSRTAERLDKVLEELRSDPSHPYTIIGRRVGRAVIRRTLWQHLPLFCSGCLLVGSVLAWFGLLQAVPRP